MSEVRAVWRFRNELHVHVKQETFRPIHGVYIVADCPPNGLFLEEYKSFTELESSVTGIGGRVLGHSNFRNRPIRHEYQVSLPSHFDESATFTILIITQGQSSLLVDRLELGRGLLYIHYRVILQLLVVGAVLTLFIGIMVLWLRQSPRAANKPVQHEV